MKIGILTFHNAQNYGAFLQCYSLSKRLAERFPEHCVEVIDYNSSNLLHDYEKSFWQKIFGASGSMKPSLSLVAKRFVKSILNIGKQGQRKKDEKQRKQNFTKVKKHINLSADRLVSDSPSEFADFLRGKYDVIVVGSDAIWNDNQTSKTNLYLLHDIKDCIKLSYAASTYGMDYSSKTESELRYVGESLKDFYFVGTRDSVTENYVRECTEGNVVPVHTCDPSAFIELEKLPVDMDLLKQKLVRKGVDFSRPIIGLMCGDWLARLVRKNLGDTYQYVSVYSRNGFEDVFLDDLDPFEWARVFSFFNATFTHYFHGTMFSLKNGTLTFSVEKSNNYKDKYETKIQDVLKRLSLQNQCYYEADNMDAAAWRAVGDKIQNACADEVKNTYLHALEKESGTFLDFERKLREALN